MTMNIKQYLGLVGFAFVAVWIGSSFGDAVLCLVGLGLFYAIGAIVQGELDLGDVQERLRGGVDRGSGYAPPRPPIPPRRRVQ